MTKKRNERCERCKFWHPGPTPELMPGQCRRRPPLSKGWVGTWGHDWCGEFVPLSRVPTAEDNANWRPGQ